VSALLGASVGEDDVDELYRRLWAPMVRTAKLVLGSDAAAEDVVQDAFLAVSTRLGTVGNPQAYLRRAVVNRAIGVRRRAATATRHTPPAPVTGDAEIDETWAALAVLTTRQRAALVLRFYEDLSEAQIADTLGWRPGTVKSTISRGLARLRKELA
jgi:RNA polymerase sigma-70 factor (sigma-E family)